MWVYGLIFIILFLFSGVILFFVRKKDRNYLNKKAKEVLRKPILKELKEEKAQFLKRQKKFKAHLKRAKERNRS